MHRRSQDFSKGGHTESYRGHSPDCHLNIVGCLLFVGCLQRGGGSHAPQDPPGYALVMVVTSKWHYACLLATILAAATEIFIAMTNQSNG